MSHKSQTSFFITKFLAYVKNHFSKTPKFVRTDNGGEFFSIECKHIFNSLKIVYQRSVAYTPQQNGVVERKHHHLLDMAKSFNVHANLPKKC